jgi:hypothetical protein
MYREYLLCEIRLEKVIEKTETQFRLPQFFLEALDNRKTTLFSNKAFISAIFLDPRFDTKRELSPACIEIALVWIEKKPCSKRPLTRNFSNPSEPEQNFLRLNLLTSFSSFPHDFIQNENNKSISKCFASYRRNFK